MDTLLNIAGVLLAIGVVYFIGTKFVEMRKKSEAQKDLPKGGGYPNNPPKDHDEINIPPGN